MINTKYLIGVAMYNLEFKINQHKELSKKTKSRTRDKELRNVRYRIAELAEGIR